jgi:Dolichyl-phosphate-mannose-protein mannosyltransferase
MLRRNIVGAALMAAAAAAGAWTVLTWLTGGFALHWGRLRIDSHDPVRPLVAAAVCAVAAWVLLPRADFASRVRRATGNVETASARVAVAASIAVLIASIAWNTRAAGGSDSSCYLLQADAFARGDLVLRDTLAASAPFPNAGGLFAPTGFLPSPTDRLAAVPICAPGLALSMAAASIIVGRGAAMLVVPVFAAIAIWLTFVYGRQLEGPLTGAISAALVACSPIFLYQSVQPMSDVPATTLWLAAVVACAHGRAWSDIAAGLCGGLAVLTRPNLALVLAPLVLVLMARDSAVPSRRSIAPFLRFVAGSVPPFAALAWLNAVRYGAPFASGYGDAHALFQIAHVWPNLRRYPAWMIETQTPLILLAFLAPGVLRRNRILVVASLLSVLLLFATYLAYLVFDEWWYLRFMLPAVPILVALSVAVAMTLAPRPSPRWVAAAAVCASVAFGAWYLHVARSRQVFALQSLESRFVEAGHYASAALPSNAVVLSVQESGALRYHGTRMTMMWDAVEDIDETARWLRSLDRPTYLALEDWEEAAFRRRFDGQALGALDWPPMAEIHAPVRVRFYDVRDRARYLNGERLSITHVR